MYLLPPPLPPTTTLTSYWVTSRITQCVCVCVLSGGYKHWANLAQPLGKHCPSIGQTLPNHWATLPNLAQPLGNCCPSIGKTEQTLPNHCESIAQALGKPCPIIGQPCPTLPNHAQASGKHCPIIGQTLPKHWATIPQTLGNQHWATVAQALGNHCPSFGFSGSPPPGVGTPGSA